MLYLYNKGGFIIQEKIYYSQKYIIDEIHNRTGYSTDDVTRILNSLNDVVRDKFSDADDYVEIKIFPGLKITSQYVLPEQSRSNLNIANMNYILSLKAAFSDYFRKEIRTLHDHML